MCDSCIPKKPTGKVSSEVVDMNPDLPNGRKLSYQILIPDEVFKLPLDEYMGYISRTLDRQWSALYDGAKEEYVKYNEGLLNPQDFTRP